MKNKVEAEVKRMKKKKKLMRKAAAVYKASAKPVLKLAKMFGESTGSKDFACNLMMPYTMAMEEESNCYITYDLYPKKAEDCNDWQYYAGENAKKCCIVMQGPLRLQEDFTLETVRYYGRCYPGVTVVVSTWTGEDAAAIEKLKAEKNCVVIQSVPPKSGGDGNINFQRVSSLEGAKKAKELNKEYVLKTRTDMRITMPGVLDQLVSLVETNPIAMPGRQKRRVIFFNAFLFLPYMESGCVYFGDAEDIIVMFSEEGLAQKKYDVYDGNLFAAQKTTHRQAFDKGNSLINFAKFFFLQMGEDVQCDIGQWWDVLGRRALCLPISCLRLIWIKYDFNHEQSDFEWMFRRKLMGMAGFDNSIISFGMWNDMRQGKFQLAADDYMYLIEQPMI